MAELSRKDRRRLERERTREERLREHARRVRGRRLKRVLTYGLYALVAAAVVFGLYRWFTRELPGEFVTSLGNQHISDREGRGVSYNTDPPTSGPHVPNIARWGVHKEPIPKALQVHNLEDGGVLVQYRCRDCPDLIARIEAIVRRYPDRVIAAPYPGMKPLIALTAWGRIDRLDAFDEARIVRFIEAFRGIDHHPRR
ncbi:MAG: DUF3105 domain-containing protein [Nitrospinota bacterium]